MIMGMFMLIFLSKNVTLDISIGIWADDHIL